LQSNGVALKFKPMGLNWTEHGLFVLAYLGGV